MVAGQRIAKLVASNGGEQAARDTFNAMDMAAFVTCGPHGYVVVPDGLFGEEVDEDGIAEQTSKMIQPTLQAAVEAAIGTPCRIEGPDEAIDQLTKAGIAATIVAIEACA